MEGVKSESFFSCINMVGSAAYKAVSKVGALGQRLIQVVDLKGAVSSVFSKISSCVQSFFCSQKETEMSEEKYTELLVFSREAPKVSPAVRKIFSGLNQALGDLDIGRVHVFNKGYMKEEDTDRDSMSSGVRGSEYRNVDLEWTLGSKIVDQNGEEIGVAL